jgi:hypothetical protein
MQADTARSNGNAPTPAIGGRLTVPSSSGAGTRIEAWAPFEAQR